MYNLKKNIYHFELYVKFNSITNIKIILLTESKQIQNKPSIGIEK